MPSSAFSPTKRSTIPSTNCNPVPALDKPPDKASVISLVLTVPDTLSLSCRAVPVSCSSSPPGLPFLNKKSAAKAYAMKGPRDALASNVPWPNGFLYS